MLLATTQPVNLVFFIDSENVNNLAANVAELGHRGSLIEN
jgi:hypothetical protein